MLNVRSPSSSCNSTTCLSDSEFEQPSDISGFGSCDKRYIQDSSFAFIKEVRLGISVSYVVLTLAFGYAGSL